MAGDWMSKTNKTRAAARGHVGKGVNDKLARYGRANVKADNATAHAATPVGDNIKGHQAAAQAHRVAANAAVKAGLPAYRESHLQQAHAHNMNVIFHQQPSKVNAMTAGAASSRAAVAGGRAAQDYHGHFATFEAGHAAKYEAANTKAGVASTKAAASGSYTDHKAAAQAHRNAAGMANKADKVGNQITHAATAKAHEEMAKKSNVLTTRGRSGSFGTDPTTGNTQSKAQVSGVGVKGQRMSGVQHEADTHSGKVQAKADRLVAGARAGHNVLGQDNQKKVASMASTQANKASASARSISQHEAAASAHNNAAVEHQAAGNLSKATSHKTKAATHLSYASKLTTMAAAENSKRGGGSNSAHTGFADRFGVTAHDRMLAESKNQGKSPFARMDAERATTTAEHATAKTKLPGGDTSANHSAAAKAHVEAASLHRQAGDLTSARLHDNLATNHATIAHSQYNRDNRPKSTEAKTGKAYTASHGALPMSDSSNRAAVASSKANAKPSLVSHSLAAKAHLQAAATHTELATKATRAGLPAQAAEHQTQAATHNMHATAHSALASQLSHHIQKLKKLGPGQHHGAKGQFTGTPGGAK